MESGRSQLRARPKLVRWDSLASRNQLFPPVRYDSCCSWTQEWTTAGKWKKSKTWSQRFCFSNVCLNGGKGSTRLSATFRGWDNLRRAAVTSRHQPTNAASVGSVLAKQTSGQLTTIKDFVLISCCWAGRWELELEFSMIWTMTGPEWQVVAVGCFRMMIQISIGLEEWRRKEGRIRRCQVNGCMKAMKRDLKYVKYECKENRCFEMAVKNPKQRNKALKLQTI